MVIRSALDSDIPALCGLLAELYALEKDFKIDPSLQAKGLELLLKESSCAVLVAQREEKILGMASLQPHISTAFGCQDLVLEDLVVGSPYRGKGLGHALLQAAEAKAKEMGFQRLRLAADLFNERALLFYERYGWQRGRMVTYYRVLQN